MLKETIKYEDFDGNPQEETWHFHLSPAELVEVQMELGYRFEIDPTEENQAAGLQDKLNEIVKTGSPKLIIETFKYLIEKTVGKRDGNLFVKDEEIRKQFMLTNAYSTFFMGLVTDANKAAEFIKAVLPKVIADKVANLETLTGTPNESPQQATPAEEDTRPAWVREGRLPNKKELMAMPQEQLVKLMQERAAGTTPTATQSGD